MNLNKKLNSYLGTLARFLFVTFVLTLLLGTPSLSFGQNRTNRIHRLTYGELLRRIEQLQAQLNALQQRRGGWYCSSECGIYSNYLGMGEQMITRTISSKGHSIGEAFDALVARCGHHHLYMRVEGPDRRLETVSPRDVCIEDPNLEFPAEENNSNDSNHVDTNG